MTFVSTYVHRIEICTLNELKDINDIEQRCISSSNRRISTVIWHRKCILFRCRLEDCSVVCNLNRALDLHRALYGKHSGRWQHQRPANCSVAPPRGLQLKNREHVHVHALVSTVDAPYCQGITNAS